MIIAGVDIAWVGGYTPHLDESGIEQQRYSLA